MNTATIGRTTLEAEEFESVREDRQRLYWQLERSQRSAAAERVRLGFTAGEERQWEELLDAPLAFTADPVAGFLEAATEDTYLAVDARTVSTTQPSPGSR